jgi:signal transduction histidine kinase
MDQVGRLKNQVRNHFFLLVVLENVLLIGTWWSLSSLTSLDAIIILPISLVFSLILSFILAILASGYAIEPVRALWQSILRLSPTDQGVAAPDLKKLRAGQELVTNLAAQVNQLANVASQVTAAKEQQAKDPSQNFVAKNLPLPLLILDSLENIVFANDAAVDYIGIPAADLKGKNVYMVLDMSFPSADTFDKWLKDAKLKNATASRTWERVRLNVRDNHPVRLFDLAVFYNRANPDRLETMLALFDHTKQYSQDEQAVSFIALTVHELRTPLTLLRGYIEVFQDELIDKVDPELQSFILKMRSQAEQLTGFVNNILNVARVDDDQLELKLEEGNWPEILKIAINNLSLQAKVRGITLRCRLATDLPTVGVDRLSVQEVVNNLVDNAIKYSGASKVINIDAHLTKDGLVETTVQDFGLGISNSIMPNLFTKFYRDHRNRAQIGGTGLGLYLSKAIINAHGGTIWVRSKEGQGSTFGFTLVPYAKMAEEMKHSGDKEIARSAHGWIKNHSLYRR